MTRQYSAKRIFANQSNKGFTLIELLVVIAIIAILAAILFPVFATAREKARGTTCESNMKQLGLAVAQYTNDYDEAYPAGCDMNNTSWAQNIFPYVKTLNAYMCPDDTMAGPAQPVPTGQPWWTTNGIWSSYRANSLANVTSWGPFTVNSAGVFGTKPPWGNPISVVTNPVVQVNNVTSTSTTIMLFEAHADVLAKAGDWPNNSASGWGWGAYMDGVSQGTLPTACGSSCTDSYLGWWPGWVNGCVTATHTGLANFLYCDGHVKALDPRKTVDPSGAWNETNLDQWYAQHS